MNRRLDKRCEDMVLNGVLQEVADFVGERSDELIRSARDNPSGNQQIRCIGFAESVKFLQDRLLSEHEEGFRYSSAEE